MAKEKNDDTPGIGEGAGRSPAQDPESPERIDDAAENLLRGLIKDSAAYIFDRIPPGPVQTNEEPNGIDAERILANALIYIVDDEAGIRRMLHRIFNDAGYKNIRMFEDGDEVLAAMFDPDGAVLELPDVILSDTNMERVSGPAMHRQIANANLERDPVVIALSGNSKNQDEWGKVIFMVKPFDNKEILAKVKDELIRCRAGLRN